MSLVCAGCYKKVPKREYLTCIECNNAYDLECANVSSKRFYNTMSQENKQKWKCQACYCKMLKTGNENTPVRYKDYNITLPHNKSPEISNVTMRKHSIVQNTDSTNSENTTFEGDDTICFENTGSGKHDVITLKNLGDVITQKLQQNNSNIMIQIQNIIKTEVQEAIKTLREEFKQEINILNEENKNRMVDIQVLNNKIGNLQKENDLIKKQMEDIEAKFVSNSSNKYSEGDGKKIVLYGLAEYYKEPECELYERIHGLFRDLLHVDLTGYIEDTYRIGRHNRNGNRPLVIELLSKRMVKHLIENSYYFKQTGLSLSQFLDKATLLKRKAMRDEMLLARRKGLHAVLRNNKLYVEGKFINLNENIDTNKTPSNNKINEKTASENNPTLSGVRADGYHSGDTHDYNNSFRN